jgi:hypothetical protein
MSQFYHDNLKVAVVITRSEASSEEDKKNLYDQLNQHAFFSDLLKKKNVTVLYMGCLDRNMLQSMQAEQIKNYYVHIYQMRKKVLEYIFSADRAIQLTDLPINRSFISSSIESINNLRGVLKRFKECKDAELAWVFEEAKKFADEMQKLMVHDYLQTHPELHPHFMNLRDDIIAVKESPAFRGNAIIINLITRNTSL